MKMEKLLNETNTIREMCKIYEVTPRTLRFYEQKELLAPLRLGTKRLFTRRDRARMTLIERGKRFGFSLEEIRQLLEVYDRTRDEHRQMEMAQGMAVKRLAEMQQQHAELEARIGELKTQIAFCNDMLESCSSALLKRA